MSLVCKWQCIKCKTEIKKVDFSKIDRTHRPYRVMADCPSCSKTMMVEPVKEGE